MINLACAEATQTASKSIVWLLKKNQNDIFFNIETLIYWTELSFAT
jgi:hypothetical protein